VSAVPARAADANGWYNHAVSVAFSGSDPTSGIASCTSGSYSGPDSSGAGVAGSCTDKAGNTGTASFGLRYDSTPPTVNAATPDRAPDANGWYNHALKVGFGGADATSGIASCDTATYDKPNAAPAQVAGRCTDIAGNVSAPGAFAFKYDSTPPTLGNVQVSSLDGSVTLTWKASEDVAGMTIARSKVGASPVTLYNGKRETTFTDKRAKNGYRYTYVLTAVDAAGNDAVLKAVATPTASLLSPRASAHVHGGATLRWRVVKKASYYNVQLWFKGKKFLTTWPAGATLKLPKLKPGKYTWFVWPGLGPRAKHHYGPLIGQSTFVVTR
jgi:hypothetical protein